MDKAGVTKTVMLAPDKAPLVTNDAFATNHQGMVDWPENAQFNQTLKRSIFIRKYLQSKNISAKELAKAFLHPPLYNTKFKEGFGTLYTAVYQPENLIVKILWPDVSIERSFKSFKEEHLLIQYDQTGQTVLPESARVADELPSTGYSWQDAVVDSLVKAMAGRKSKAKQDDLRKRLRPDGKIAWNVLIDYWNEP